jgi:hypothetical protein
VIRGTLEIGRVEAVKGVDYEIAPIEGGLSSIRSLGKRPVSFVEKHEYGGTKTRSYFIEVVKISVAAAHGESGKPIPRLVKGTLRIVGAKEDDIFEQCHQGLKEVEIRGIVKNGTTLDALSSPSYIH